MPLSSHIIRVSPYWLPSLWQTVTYMVPWVIILHTISWDHFKASQWSIPPHLSNSKSLALYYNNMLQHSGLAWRCCSPTSRIHHQRAVRCCTPPPAYCSRESAVLQPHLQNEVQSPCCYADYSTMDNEVWEEYPSTSNAVQHKNAECKQKNTSHLRWHWIRQFVKGVLLLIRGKDSIWLRFILIIWTNPHTMKTCYFGHGSKRYDVQFVKLPIFQLRLENIGKRKSVTISTQWLISMSNECIPFFN